VISTSVASAASWRRCHEYASRRGGSPCSSPPGARSKIRPPARGSNTTASGPPETEWLPGHHSEVRSAQTENACSGAQPTVNSCTSGSVTSCSPRRS
jgi:hypothetical protein